MREDISKYTVGETYKLVPDTIRFNDEYVKFNPLHTDREYMSTKLSIEENGQLRPIYMLNGECVDGRHRSRICKELGIEVLAVNLDPELPRETIYDLCNIDTVSGRNLTPTQRGISAYRQYAQLGTTQDRVATKFQVPRQSIVYVKKLVEVYGQEEAIEELHKGMAVQLVNMDNPSKSLEFVCKKAKELYENSLIVVEENARIQFNPDSLLKTEASKAWFYKRVKEHELDGPVSIKMRYDLIELANLKYRLKGSNDE